MTETYRQPRTLAEGRRAVSIKRGVGEQRHVDWDHIKTRDVSDRYPIHVREGNTLTIDVWSGLPFFVIESGHVTINFWSSWGNSLKIRPGASAHVRTDSRTKVTIENEGALTVDAPDPNRVHVYGPGHTSGVEPMKPLIAEVSQP